MELDILFSDHHLSGETLKAFGAVVSSIRGVCEDDDLCFWSFIHYVSTRHPNILGVNMSPEQRERCEAVVARANPPPIAVEESKRAKMMRKLMARHGNADPDAGARD
jgi:hypothetical protein